jgi:hypothetical protein
MSPKEDESEIAGLHEFSLEMLKLDFDAPALSPLNSSLMDEINAVGCDDQEDQENENSNSELDLSDDETRMLDELGPINPAAEIVIEWQALTDDQLLMLEALDIEEKSDHNIKDRVSGMVEIWTSNQARLKAVKTSRKTQTDTQREIDAYRAGPGRPDYNEYQRTLYAAKIEATEGRTVRSYGVPNDEAKLAKRRERNRLAAIASRERAKAKRAGA